MSREEDHHPCFDHSCFQHTTEDPGEDTTEPVPEYDPPLSRPAGGGGNPVAHSPWEGGPFPETPLAVLVVTVLMIVALFMAFLVWHVIHESSETEIENPLTPPPENLPVQEPPESGLGEDEWEGLIEVWSSIREQFDHDPNSAIVYADLVVSDMLLDRSSPFLHDSNAACEFEIGQVKRSYRTAHEITAGGKSRPLSERELQDAMALYASVFDQFRGVIAHKPSGHSAFGDSPQEGESHRE